MSDQHPEQPGQGPDDRPQYGIRLTPEQQAEHQARLDQARRARDAQQGQQSQQGQRAQSPYGHPSPYGQPPSQQYPGQQHPDQQPFGPIETPRSIIRSYWLIIAAGIAFLIVEMINLLSPTMGLTPEMMDLYREQMEASGVDVDLESLLPTVRVVAAVFTAILVGLYWLIATGIRRGSNLARIFGTILAAMSLLGAFGPGFTYVILGVAGIVYAYLTPSSEYLRAKAWEKAMRRR